MVKSGIAILELENYKYIEFKDIHKIKPGGFVRYIDQEDALNWGGLVLQIEQPNDMNKCKILLTNFENKYNKTIS